MHARIIVAHRVTLQPRKSVWVRIRTSPDSGVCGLKMQGRRPRRRGMVDVRSPTPLLHPRTVAGKTRMYFAVASCRVAAGRRARIYQGFNRRTRSYNAPETNARTQFRARWRKASKFDVCEWEHTYLLTLVSCDGIPWEGPSRVVVSLIANSLRGRAVVLRSRRLRVEL